MKKFTGAALLISFLVASGPAYAKDGMSSSVSLVGAFNSSSGKDNGNNTWSADGMGAGAGVLMDLSLGSALSFDIGALYIQRKITNTDAFFPGLTVNAALKGIEVPIGLRYWFANVFSVGAGAYYIHYSSATVSATFKGASASVSENVSGADDGLYASAQFRLPLGDRFGFLLDGRYDLGFKRSSGDLTIKLNDLQGLVGLSLMF